MADDPQTFGRRDLARYFAASAVVAAGCARAPRGKIVPFGQQPEDTPGVPRFYATSMTVGGYGTGLLAESHDGRPTKIEGNALHPASLGGSSALHQAQTLTLYDPDRLGGVRRGTQPSSLEALLGPLARGSQAKLDRTAILAEPTSSPVLASLLDDAVARGARVFFHDPLPRTNIWEGSRLAFGRVLEPVFDFTRADVVVALDADVFGEGPFHVRYARERTQRRRAAAEDPGRLYVAEPALSLTGGVADHRLAMRRSEIPALAQALAHEARRALSTTPEWLRALPSSELSVPEAALRWARAAVKDLVAHRGRAVVVAGPGQPAATHALAVALTHALGSDCVRFVESPIHSAGESTFDVEPLLAAIDQGTVDLLVTLGGNPAYDASPDADFTRRVRGARERIYLAPYENETAATSTALVPAAHFLESWQDTRALDGTVSFAQPLILPLYGGLTAPELLTRLFGDGVADGHALLLAHGARRSDGFARAFDVALESGVLDGSGSPSVAVAPALDAKVFERREPASGLEVSFHEDTRVRDGAFTNAAWLLELPEPVTQQTWGNAATLGARTARELGVVNGDVLELRADGRSLQAPVVIAPGHAEGSVRLSLGYGRAGAETLARGVGFDAGRLRARGAPWLATHVTATKTGRAVDLVLAQTHDSMEGRDPAVDVSVADLHRRRDPLAAARATPPSIYEPHAAEGVQWGMTIDLDACTGCQSCLVACQSENNIPVVGPEGVAKGRIMHWLRIDRYFEGEGDAVEVRHQPLACVHCEKAPCEYVCPVGATVHSDDGLNEMVYNRCVGTRFCSNNCPYKVRRFNWFDYNRDKPETLRMMMNPDVTVRARGVMEKCTYCVQRIRETEIRNHATGRALADGDVTTACEQACPSQAITFGAISDPTSRVARLRDTPRAYALLSELGTQPRTRYLARVENPNPELPR